MMAVHWIEKIIEFRHMIRNEFAVGLSLLPIRFNHYWKFHFRFFYALTKKCHVTMSTFCYHTHNIIAKNIIYVMLNVP